MKFGITFEGGASRTLFSCGVMDALIKENIMADYIIGASAGISYGVTYASKQFGRNLEITRKYMNDKRYMGMRNMFVPKNRAYYNMDFVFDEIPNKLVPYDYVSYANYKGKCVAVVTNVKTGKAEYLEVPRNDRKWQVLRASCALPLLIPKVKIGGEYYLDGGIADSFPFEKAISEGCDKNIVVLTRERGYVKKHETASKVAELYFHKYPNLARALKNRADNYNACIKRLEELEKAGKALVIAPESTLGVSRTESDPVKLEKLYDLGYKQTMKIIPEIRRYLYE